MKRPIGVVLIDIVIALGLGFGVWLSQRKAPRYTETKASR